jgi:predicted glycosyltransferase
VSDTSPRLLAYSHDGYGLGHLRRNLRISHGLRRHRPDVDVLLATGAQGADRLAAASGIAHVRLPSLVKAGTGRYKPADPGWRDTDAVVAERSAILAETVGNFAPDVLLVDRHPRGLHGELDAALEIHRSRRPRASTVLGLRDILDEPPTVAREWQDQQLSAAIERYYDTVLCYGDPAVYDPVAAYRLPADVAAKIRYTGYLTDDLAPADAPALRRAHAKDGRLAVCTLGGGQDGAAIATAFLQAMLHLREQRWHGVLITGPYMATPDVDALHAHAAACDVAVIRMATDVPSYLAAADAVFCMGGYNTTCEVLALRVPAVIVPRTQPRLEQLMRARALARRGLLHWLHPDGLTPRVVAGALAYVADTPQQDLKVRITGLAHTGVHTTARALADLLPASDLPWGTASRKDRVVRAIG